MFSAGAAGIAVAAGTEAVTADSVDEADVVVEADALSVADASGLDVAVFAVVFAAGGVVDCDWSPAGAAGPPTASTADLQASPSLATFSCRHFSDASPPGGIEAQYFR